MSLIGLYDSGLGGLSVLREVRVLLPQHDLLYLADTAYCPYGPRSVAVVQDRALACASWLVAQGAKVVVVACNRATSDAIEVLRSRLTVPIVGMEPGIKPAIQATRMQRVGVLATGGTLAGQRFAALVQRFAAGIEIQTVPCSDLVVQVEAGDLDGPATRERLERHLAPLREYGVDTIVLGCTHFPFLTPLIAEIAGPHVTIIDTGPAVARQVARVVAAANLAPGRAATRYAATGDPERVAPVLARLAEEAMPLVEYAAC